MAEASRRGPALAEAVSFLRGRVVVVPAMSGARRRTQVAEQMTRLRERHARKPSLIDRFDRARLD